MHHGQSGGLEVIEQLGQEIPGRQFAVLGVAPQREHLFAVDRCNGSVAQVTQPTRGLAGIVTCIGQHDQPLAEGLRTDGNFGQLLTEAGDAHRLLVVESGVDAHLLEADQLADGPVAFGEAIEVVGYASQPQLHRQLGKRLAVEAVAVRMQQPVVQAALALQRAEAVFVLNQAVAQLAVDARQRAVNAAQVAVVALAEASDFGEGTVQAVLQRAGELQRDRALFLHRSQQP